MISWLTDILSQANYHGLLIGFSTFLVIGAFHPLVIKAEYHFGTGCWWCFLLLGILSAIAALSFESQLLSALLGVVSFSSFWSILELFEQEERVRKGWFPKNPQRTYKF